MPALDTIKDHLHRSFYGNAWHGPALLKILSDVTAPQAGAKPVADAHSIWELVLHITTWQAVVVRRLGGEAYNPSDAEDFPPVMDTSETAWAGTVNALRRQHDNLYAAVERLPESRLPEVVPGEEYTVEFMLQGIIQHDLYHAGQMALLKKALR